MFPRRITIGWVVTVACIVTGVVLAPEFAWSQGKFGRSPGKTVQPIRQPITGPSYKPNPVVGRGERSRVEDYRPYVDSGTRGTRPPFIPKPTPPRPNPPALGGQIIDIVSRIPSIPINPLQPSRSSSYYPSNVVPSIVVPGNGVPGNAVVSTYIAPSNGVPGNLVPGNVARNNVAPSNPTVRANEIDFPVDPKQNTVDDIRFSLTDDERRDLSRDVQTLETNQADSVATHLSGVVYTDERRDQLVSQIAMTDPVRAAAIDMTLQARPIDTGLLTTQLMGVAGVNATHVVDQARITNALNEYRDAVARGASSTEIRTRADALAQAQSNAIASGAIVASNPAIATAALRSQLDQQVALAGMREQLAGGGGAGGGGGGGGAGGNQAIVIAWPQLAQGEVVIVGPHAVVKGVGEDGKLSTLLDEAPDLGGVPFVPGQPVPASDPANGVTSGFLLTNPVGSPGTISYMVNGTEFSMEKGYSQHLPAGQAYVVTFDAGGGKAVKEYALEGEGVYEFGIEKNAWDLWKVTQKVTLDNSANRKDFNFVFGNEQMTVRAKKGFQLESAFPLAIHFDQGKGAAAAVRLLGKGTYRIGVTPSGLDVFAAAPRPLATASAPRTNASSTALAPPKRSAP